jgi:MerR family copper efflux transcriptional regulator
VLSARSASARREVTASHRERLRERIARAQAALDMIEGECPHEEIMTCPRFQGFLADRLQRDSVAGSDHHADRAAEADGTTEATPDEPA